MAAKNNLRARDVREPSRGLCWVSVRSQAQSELAHYVLGGVQGASVTGARPGLASTLSRPAWGSKPACPSHARPVDITWEPTL